MAKDPALSVTAGARLPTRHGVFLMEAFRVRDRDREVAPTGWPPDRDREVAPTRKDPPHLALSVGLGSGALPLVRVHSECVTGEVFGSVRCDCGEQLDESLRRIHEAGCGVLVYLRQEGRGIGIENKLSAYALQDQGLDTVDANVALGLPVDARSYRPAALYLHHRGVHRCVLLTNNPDKVRSLRGHGIDVSRAPLRSAWHETCRAYLETKRLRLGQDL